MVVYFDKQNIISFIRSAKDRRFSDCMRMLQDYCDIKLTFPKSETSSMSDDEKEDFYQWFSLLSDGSARDDFFNWDSQYPPRPFEYNHLRETQHFSSVYCLECNSKLSDCILVANLGEELSKLSTLFVTSNQFTHNIFRQITKWEDIKKYSSPCTDIIIVDKFLLTSPELYTSNLYSLIRTLCSDAEQTRLNIVIFTLKEVYNRETKYTFVPDWDKIYQSIRKCVGKRTPSPNVTFVTASDQKLDEHDRTIFTNYKTFASGDSYNYFNSAGDRITKGRYLHVHSLAEAENRNDAVSFLEDMQKIIDDLLKLNSRLIMKDKICNYLTFS